MAFFKSFQQNLPSVNISSLLDSVSSRVDDLATAVSDVTYSASNQLSEQVTTIIGKVQEDGGGPDEDQAGGGEDAEAQEEGRASRRAKRRTSILRDAWGGDPEADQRTAGGGGTEGGGGGGGRDAQPEWEWRDGCWRVKRTQEELAEEGRRKDRERQWEEERERKRRERRERQMERQGKARMEKEVVGVEEEEVKGQESKANGHPHNLEDGKEEEEDIPEEQEDEHGEAGDEEEECLASAAPTKKKKSGKNKGKDAKTKKKKSKKKGGKEEEASDSEDDRRPEPAVPQKTGSVWNNKHKQTNEEGYSSEASSGQTNSIQRIQRDSSLNELQPPPYQDEEVSKRASRSRPGRGVRRGSSPERCSSEASGDQDTESYLNKVYDEDAPSDSTAVLGPEDASGPCLPVLAYEPEPLAKYGTLDVAFEYDSGEQWLAVTVTAATDIPEPKQTGSMAWQVHLVLLPTKKQRAKTGVQKGPCPVFTETFKFSRLEQEALGEYAVRFRLYSVRRMKKEKVLGEKVFCLTKLKLQGKMALPVTLEPGSELTGCGSLVSVSRSAGAYSYRSTGDASSPEILLGLTYNAATGHLSTEVIQGSHFKNTASDKPTSDLFCCVKHFIGGQLYIMRDTYVKLTLLDSKGKEMSKWKTSVCRGQPNPTYKETFVFQVALFQLSEVSLVVSVFCRRSNLKPRERIGWVSLGLDSTGEDQQTHWNQMREAEGQQVSHWHTLAVDT